MDETIDLNDVAACTHDEIEITNADCNPMDKLDETIELNDAVVCTHDEIGITNAAYEQMDPKRRLENEYEKISTNTTNTVNRRSVDYENIKINSSSESVERPSNVAERKLAKTSDNAILKTLEEQATSLKRLQIVCVVLGILIVMCSVTLLALVISAMTRIDNIEKVTVHGGWSTWAHWTTCSSSCGQGLTRRLRSCTNPRPSLLGNPCFGDLTEYAVCLIKQCPVDGQWTDWLQWSSCGVSCGSGHMTRQRLCLNPKPSNGGRSCAGSGSDQRTCQAISCPVMGGWSSWSSWSSCTKSCNTGQKQRHRTCSNPAPVGLGRTCTGNSDELSNCNENPCPDYKSAFAIFGQYPTQGTSGAITFPSVKTNIGGHYNIATGQFTCQYPGIYVFSLNLYKKSGASKTYCYIRRNGGGVARADVPAESKFGYYESSGSTVLHLDRGDKVDVGGCNSVNDIDSYTSFIGFLLKAD